MSKKFLIGCAMTLMVAGQESFAASVYSFSGGIDKMYAYQGATVSTYVADGVYVGAPVAFDILLDSTMAGSWTSHGSKIRTTYEPRYVVDATNTAQTEVWASHASLVNSNINIDVMRSPTSNSRITYDMYKNYSFFATHVYPDNPYNRGWIRVGSTLSIIKTMEYENPRAFVEGWQVGDTLEYSFSYDTNAGLGGVYVEGTLTLTAISAPLPTMTPAPSPVPIPGASMLFFSGLACMGGLKRMRRSRRIAA